MTETTFYGYPGRVWAVCFAALQDLATALGTAADPVDTLPMANAVVATLFNGLNAINANRIAYNWTSELAVLQAIQILPITAPPPDLVYINNRILAMQLAVPVVTALVPQPNLSTVASSLAQGNPAIPDCGLLEFLMAFNYEAFPVGLTSQNIMLFAQAYSQAWTDLAAAVAALQGGSLTYLYDQPVRFANEINAVAEMLGEFPAGLSTSISPSVLWNQMLALPSLLLHTQLLTGAPNNIQYQQEQLLRFLILFAIQQVENLILNISRPVAAVVQQATVLAGDSLMDIAARYLGDYRRWFNVAEFNFLVPPFIGPRELAGIATWGSKILLPVSGANPATLQEQSRHRVSGLGSAAYLFNFLGVDIYFGPINGDFPTWGGEFQLIAGYDNLRWALGRRVQTTLGTLIYHPDYGCLIPPEVGNVQTNDTASHTTAFGKAALQADPRVQSVLNAITLLGRNFSLNFAAEVQPGGFGSTPVQVNEVINSGVAPATITRG